MRVDSSVVDAETAAVDDAFDVVVVVVVVAADADAAVVGVVVAHDAAVVDDTAAAAAAATVVVDGDDVAAVVVVYCNCELHEPDWELFVALHAVCWKKFGHFGKTYFEHFEICASAAVPPVNVFVVGRGLPLASVAVAPELQPFADYFDWQVLLVVDI